MKERLLKTLNISAQDLEKLLPLLLLNSLIVIGNILGTIATHSLFVVRFGIEKLPLAYMLTAVVSIGFSLWIFAVSKYIRRPKLFVIIFSAFSGLIFLCRILANIETIEKGIWFYPFLFVIVRIFTLSFTPMLFWSLSNEICNSRQAKKLFPLIMVGAQVGIIAICFAVKYIIGFIGAKNIYFLWDILLVSSILIFLRVYSKFFVVTASDSTQKAVINFRSLRNNFTAVIKKSPFVKILAVSVILLVVLNNSVEFNYYSIIKDVFPNVNKFATVDGVIRGFANVLILFLQLFITNRILGWFGVGVALLILPFGMLLNFTLLLLFYTFACAVFIRINTESLKFSIEKPVSAIIFNPIEKKKRDQTITYISGFVQPMGEFIAGAMILGLRVFPAKTILITVSLGLSLVYLFIEYRLKGKYVQMILQNLKGTDYDGRFTAIKIMQNIKDPRVNRSLIEALGDRNPVIRSNACLALSKMKNKEVVSSLLNSALKDDNKYVRAAAVQALGEIGDTNTVEQLIGMLKKEYTERVRATIISALKRFQDKTVANKLLGFLNDEDARVRANTVEVLGVLGGENLKERFLRLLEREPNNRVRSNTIIAIYPWTNEADKNLLSDWIVKMIESDISTERASGYFVIGAIKEPGFIEYLNRGTADKDPMVRRQLATALGKFQGSFIINPIIKLLGDEDNDVGNAAGNVVLEKKGMFLEGLIKELPVANIIQKRKIVELLGQIRNPKGLSPIQALLTDPDEEVRLTAVIALGKFKVETSVDLLIPLLKDQSSKVQATVVKVLAKINPVRLRSQIKEKLKDENPHIRANALEALSVSPYPNIIADLKPYLYDDHHRVKAVASVLLWRNQNKEGIPILKEMLTDEDKWVRSSAIYALGEIGNPDFIKDLLVVLNDEDLDIRRNVATALEKIGGPAIESLEKFLRQKGQDLIEENRKLILEIIDQIVSSKDEELKMIIGQTLTHIGYSEVNDILKKNLLDKDNLVLKEKLLEALNKFKYEHLLLLSLKGLNFIDLNSQLKVSELLSHRQILLKQERDTAVQYAEIIINLIKDYQRYKAHLRSLAEYRFWPLLNKRLEQTIDTHIKIVMNILMGLGNRSQLETIVKKLDDPDERVRANALEAMESVADRYIIKLFMPHLERRVMQKDKTEETMPDITEGLKALWDIFRIPDLRIRILCVDAISEVLLHQFKIYLDKVDSERDLQVKNELLKVINNLREFVNRIS